MKYIVQWNVGTGVQQGIIEAASKEEALEAVKDIAYEDVESEIGYTVIGEATEDLMDEHGLDESDEL